MQSIADKLRILTDRVEKLEVKLTNLRNFTVLTFLGTAGVTEDKIAQVQKILERSENE